MSLAWVFVLSLALSCVVIRTAKVVARRFGVLDRPGGHKQHDTSTPFVGGFGVLSVVIFAFALLSAQAAAFPLAQALVLVGGAVVLFATGFADDLWHLSFKLRFVIQALVAVAMVMVAGVELQSLGSLLPGLDIELGPLAIPFTIFATVGLINAINMIDGVDGLSGSLSFISLGMTGLAAALAGLAVPLLIIVAIMGGLAGFLYFNLRYPGHRRARVFLGDNGSMLLGFLFAWLFISLSQGAQPAIRPVTALWLFGVPLLDTVSVMLRRIWMGKSPFHADRNHLHHLFLKAGFRVTDTVILVALLQLALGGCGLLSLWLGVPESAMFAAFLIVFAAYFYVIARPWRFVPNLRRLNVALGLPSMQARGVFVGYFHRDQVDTVLATLTTDLGNRYDYRLSLHEVQRRTPRAPDIFALIELDGAIDDATIGEIRRLMGAVRDHLAGLEGLHVRLFMHRHSDNDRRARYNGDDPISDCTRNGDRRAEQGSNVIYATRLQALRDERGIVRAKV